MQYNNWIYKQYVAAATELGLKTELLDSESGYLRIYNDKKYLRVFNGTPYWNDQVSVESVLYPEDYMQMLRSNDIDVNDWNWTDLKPGVPVDLDHLVDPLHSDNFFMLVSRNRQHSRFFSRETAENSVNELRGLGVRRIGVMPLFENQYLVLLCQGRVLDLVAVSSLSVVGNGTDKVGELLKQINNGRAKNGLPALSLELSGDMLDHVPQQDQYVCLEDPLTGTAGESERIDLVNLSTRELAYFRQVHGCFRLPLQILSAVRDRERNWKIQSSCGFPKIRVFLSADPDNQTYPLHRLLDAYFFHSGQEDRFTAEPDPSRLKSTPSVTSTNENIQKFQQAAKQIGLDCHLNGTDGSLLRIESNGKFLEISTRTSTYPRFSCNTGVSVTSYKDITSRILHKNGIAVPRNKLFRIRNPDSDMDRVLAYARSNYPVVIKPQSASGTRGVTTQIYTDQECAQAVHHALKVTANILVEEQIPVAEDPALGGDFRVFVMNGRVIKVMNRIGAYVVGDGANTLRALAENHIEETEVAPWEQVGRVTTDPDGDTAGVLKAQGVDFDFIPESGQKIRLLRIMSTHHGSSYNEIELDHVHPDILDMFCRTNAVLGVTWSGIDFLSADISRSYKDIHCGINEVNDKPGINTAMRIDRGFPERILNAYFDLDGRG